MRIAVIDDEKYSREELAHQIREILPAAQITEAVSGVEAMELLEQKTFDVLFIDIHLGDMMGTTVASLARKLMPKAQIVFATAFAEYGVKAFELGVDNYILKPLDPQRVEQVLKLCENALHKKPDVPAPMQRLAVTVRRHTTFISAGDVVYIETSPSNRSCLIHTADKTYETSESLSSYETKLSPLGFFRIHKTCLVQLARIRDIFPWSNNSFALHMQGFSCVLPIGRERIKRLRELLGL